MNSAPTCGDVNELVRLESCSAKVSVTARTRANAQKPQAKVSVTAWTCAYALEGRYGRQPAIDDDNPLFHSFKVITAPMSTLNVAIDMAPPGRQRDDVIHLYRHRVR